MQKMFETEKGSVAYLVSGEAITVLTRKGPTSILAKGNPLLVSLCVGDRGDLLLRGVRPARDSEKQPTMLNAGWVNKELVKQAKADPRTSGWQTVQVSRKGFIPVWSDEILLRSGKDIGLIRRKWHRSIVKENKKRELAHAGTY